MPRNRAAFLKYMVGLMFLAIVVSFLLAVLSARSSGVLPSFLFRWERAMAVGTFAAWVPALLLVASAMAAENADGSPGFHSVMLSVLTPALTVAVLLSLFYLLVCPLADGRRAFYEQASRDFSESLALAEEALGKNDLVTAQGHALRCRAIDRQEARYVDLNDRIQARLVETASIEAPAQEPGLAAQEPARETANRFYLEALTAMKEGRFFDAHYLAKRSLAMYPNRQEVIQLVSQSWDAMQELKASPEKALDEEFYARKVQGYEYLESGDYLAAYRMYLDLAEERPSDQDTRKYLQLSADGLSATAFFLGDLERAFQSYGARPFRMVMGVDETRIELSADSASLSPAGVYFRGFSYRSASLSVHTPYAALRSGLVLLRCVDDENPANVYAPEWQPAPPDRNTANVLESGMSEDDVREYFLLSSPPTEIPLWTLLARSNSGARFGIDPKPLLNELASRLAYPFLVLILVVLGVAFGLRFRPPEKPSLGSTVFWAPALSAALSPVLGVGAAGGRVAQAALLTALPGAAFLPAWLGFLSICTVLAVLLASRIALHAPRA